LWCDFCKKPYHTKETCWKIYGKPANWKPKNRKEIPRSAYVAETPTEFKIGTNLNLSEEQIQALYRLLNQGIATQPTSYVALQGNSLFYSSNSNRLPKNVWVVDTGASDHMANSETLMTYYTLGTLPINISMADGITSPAMGFGKICVSSLRLKLVLHVPGLKCNLLSISRITQGMNCSVIFSPSYCLFQDQVSGRMIGNAKAMGGLYYLE